MALRILLADPNEEWIESAKKYLEEQLYQVDVVSNGKDAQLALYNAKFFAVVLNMEIKDHSGSQVLRFLKANHPSQNVVAVFKPMTEEEKSLSDEITDEESLKKMGATEVLELPFEMSALHDCLEGHQSLGDMMQALDKSEGQREEEEVKSEDEEYTSVKIDEFYTSKAVLFDVYIKLGTGRYLKILHAGDQFSKERIDKYKNEKKVEHLYFHVKDRRKYIQYTNFLTDKLINTDGIGADKKLSMLKNASEKFLEESFQEGMKPQIMEQGKQVAENVYNLIEKDEELFKALRDWQDFDPNAYSHAYLTTIFAAAIIKRFEWQSKTTIEAAAMACLFHDVGMTKLPKELLDKKEEDFTDEDWVEFKKHPELGAKMFEGNRTVGQSVQQIILQHHEYYDGSGFPYGKRGSKILTLSNIVCCADDFAECIVETGEKPVDALKIFLKRKEQMKRYNSRIVECLIKSFVDPEKIIKEHTLPSNSRVLASKKAS
ncbi:MAG: putative nucleotidyltransferase with HDIG domain [Bacteriovoracaceae bacterium]